MKFQETQIPKLKITGIILYAQLKCKEILKKNK